MSKATDDHRQHRIRVPTWRTVDELRDDGSPGSEPRIRELTEYRLARLEAEVLAPARGIVAVDQRLQRLISAYTAFAINDPGLMPLVSNGPCDVTMDPTGNVDRFLAAVEKNLAKVLAAQDRTPSIDPQVAVQSLLGIVHWGVSCHRAEERLSRDEATAQITFLALHGLISSAEPTARHLAQSSPRSESRLRGLRQAS